MAKQFTPYKKIMCIYENKNKRKSTEIDNNEEDFINEQDLEKTKKKKKQFKNDIKNKKKENRNLGINNNKSFNSNPSCSKTTFNNNNTKDKFYLVTNKINKIQNNKNNCSGSDDASKTDVVLIDSDDDIDDTKNNDTNCKENISKETSISRNIKHVTEDCCIILDNNLNITQTSSTPESFQDFCKNINLLNQSQLKKKRKKLKKKLNNLVKATGEISIITNEEKMCTNNSEFENDNLQNYNNNRSPTCKQLQNKGTQSNLNSNKNVEPIIEKINTEGSAVRKENINCNLNLSKETKTEEVNNDGIVKQIDNANRKNDNNVAKNNELSNVKNVNNISEMNSDTDVNTIGETNNDFNCTITLDDSIVNVTTNTLGQKDVNQINKNEKINDKLEKLVDTNQVSRNDKTNNEIKNHRDTSNLTCNKEDIAKKINDKVPNSKFFKTIGNSEQILDLEENDFIHMIDFPKRTVYNERSIENIGRDLKNNGKVMNINKEKKESDLRHVINLKKTEMNKGAKLGSCDVNISEGEIESQSGDNDVIYIDDDDTGDTRRTESVNRDNVFVNDSVIFDDTPSIIICDEVETVNKESAGAPVIFCKNSSELQQPNVQFVEVLNSSSQDDIICTTSMKSIKEKKKKKKKKNPLNGVLSNEFMKHKTKMNLINKDRLESILKNIHKAGESTLTNFSINISKDKRSFPKLSNIVAPPSSNQTVRIDPKPSEPEYKGTKNCPNENGEFTYGPNFSISQLMNHNKSVVNSGRSAVVPNKSPWGMSFIDNNNKHCPDKNKNISPDFIPISKQNSSRQCGVNQQPLSNKQCVDQQPSSSKSTSVSNIYNASASNDNECKKGKLRPIIIDGSNVAITHYKNQNAQLHMKFSSKAIQMVVDYFLKRGHEEIYCFIPNFRRGHINTINPEILEKLEKDGILHFTPSRRVDGKLTCSYDDRYIVQIAAELDGVIVSNDQYRDIMFEDDKWTATVQNRLLMFNFVKDILIFPNDPRGKNGPNLDNFLKF